jgi:hypothetical protein
MSRPWEDLKRPKLESPLPWVYEPLECRGLGSSWYAVENACYVLFGPPGGIEAFVRLVNRKKCGFRVRPNGAQETTT